MRRVRFYLFPSLCSHKEREIIFVHTEDLKEKKEKSEEVNGYEEIREKRFINCEECCRGV